MNSFVGIKEEIVEAVELGHILRRLRRLAGAPGCGGRGGARRAVQLAHGSLRSEQRRAVLITPSTAVWGDCTAVGAFCLHARDKTDAGELDESGQEGETMASDLADGCLKVFIPRVWINLPRRAVIKINLETQWRLATGSDSVFEKWGARGLGGENVEW